MDKIYVLFSGEYSDWRCEGFCENEEEAQRICLEHDWYYEIVYKQNPKNNNFKIVYEHEVVFDKKWDTVNPLRNWVMRKEPDRFNYFYDTAKIDKSSSINYYEPNPNIITAYIWSDKGEDGRDKVEKIAQDMLAKFLYQGIE